MDWLEQELRESLKREDPSPDFAERVHKKLEGGAAVSKVREMPRRTARPFPIRLAAAAVIVIAAGAGGIGYRQHQGELARQQVMQAFRIAGSSLNHIQSHVREVRR